MKKILGIISLITILASCSDGNKVVISKQEYNNLINSSEKLKPFDFINYNLLILGNNGIILGSDQHEYLIIHSNTSSQTVMHYVECELCFARKQEELNNLIKRLKDTIK